MATSLRECYELLGLPTNATEEEVRKAYKQKARECHPDKNPGDPQATEKFQALTQGYERIVSASSEEPDNVGHFGGFDSFFHFVVFREMMRQRMREEMMARMFRGVFDDDSDLDEDDFPFGAFGIPFFYRPWHHESSARSRNQGYTRHGTSSYERGSSAKTPRKQKGRKKDLRKESYPDRGANSDVPWPKQAQSQGNDSTKQDHETTKSNYGQGDCKTRNETYWEERQKSPSFTKSKQKNKNRSQMTASEWQKGRKTKKNHKRKQTAKCSSSSEFKSKTREENSDSDKESDTSVEKGQQFPQQATGKRKEREEYMCSPSPGSEEWTLEDKTNQEIKELSPDQSNHFEAFGFMEDEKNSNNGLETADKPFKHDEQDRLRKNLNPEKDVKFPQEGHKIMFDSEEFMATQRSNLNKEIPKNDEKANISSEECKMDLNIKTGNNKRERDECHQNDADKEPLQTRPCEEMKQACEETTEETPGGRGNTLYGTASTATSNNEASISASDVNRIQKDEKENVKPAQFVKTTNPCGIKSKGEKKESVETKKKDCERKKDCLDDNINAGITQTVNAEDHADRLEQSIPQKNARQGGANSFKLDEHAGYFSAWNKTDKNKYPAKAKSQFDGYLKRKSSLNELQSDSKETQKMTGNSLKRGNGSEKMQDATESISKEDSVNSSSMTSCKTTENDNMTSACCSSEAANQDFVSEQAEPIAYRKAPLDDELKLRRPSKHKKRQERRQRRLNELLSGNTLNTNLLSNKERSSSGV